MTTTTDLAVAAGRGLAARSVALDHGPDLLAEHRPGGFAWLDGDGGFVASGVAALVSPADAARVLAAIAHDARGDVPTAAGPRAVGALPFAGEGRLVVPARIVGRTPDGRGWRTEITGDHVVAAAEAGADIAPDADLAPARFTVGSATTRGTWRSMVRAVLRDIDAGNVEKIVLARSVTVDADAPFDVVAVLDHLRRTQRGCVVYADRGFVGASPELLVRKVGAHVTARPLAGTGTDPAELARSAKDAREHRVVVDAVVAALGELCEGVRAEGPSTVMFADVCHLATTVTARASGERVTIADLVTALHPTPAVAGTPREPALATIAALEPVARGRYAGPCGWIDARGDGAFVVALRGGAIDGTRAVLHAGAGIVAGSDPDAEWAETQQKLMPMLQALVRP